MWKEIDIYSVLVLERKGNVAWENLDVDGEILLLQHIKERA